MKSAWPWATVCGFVRPNSAGSSTLAKARQGGGKPLTRKLLVKFSSGDKSARALRSACPCRRAGGRERPKGAFSKRRGAWYHRQSPRFHRSPDHRSRQKAALPKRVTGKDSCRRSISPLGEVRCAVDWDQGFKGPEGASAILVSSNPGFADTASFADDQRVADRPWQGRGLIILRQQIGSVTRFMGADLVSMSAEVPDCGKRGKPRRAQHGAATFYHIGFAGAAVFQHRRAGGRAASGSSASLSISLWSIGSILFAGAQAPVRVWRSRH